jgi:hypothetical protein
MTISDIEKLDKEFLVPADIAPLLRCHPYSINVQARMDPDKLGFPVIKQGSRVKIPKEGFVRFWKYGRVILGKEYA